jgi:hypothetical protein
MVDPSSSNTTIPEMLAKDLVKRPRARLMSDVGNVHPTNNLENVIGLTLATI